MLITTDLWRTILIGMLGAGWLTLTAPPVTAQDQDEPLAMTETTMATNISTNDLSAVTNTTSSEPRTGDGDAAPGWWFEAALKQDSKYPRFLGIRFAEVARAVIIETPNRKLTVGQPLVYRLWVCNDLPQPVQCRVTHAVRKGEIVISQTNTLDFVAKASKVQAVGRFKQNTDALTLGTYTIDATLRDQNGNLLHHMTETFELLATKSARP